jgi:hypothetical protein
MKNFLLFLKDSILFKRRKDFTDVICNLAVCVGILVFLSDILLVVLTIVGSK